MRILLAALSCPKGDVTGNLDRHKDELARATRSGCDLVLDDTKRHAVPRGRWMAVATQSGATVDEDFPGWAAVIDPSGRTVAETADEREALLVIELPLPSRHG